MLGYAAEVRLTQPTCSNQKALRCGQLSYQALRLCLSLSENCDSSSADTQPRGGEKVEETCVEKLHAAHFAPTAMRLERLTRSTITTVRRDHVPIFDPMSQEQNAERGNGNAGRHAEYAPSGP